MKKLLTSIAFVLLFLPPVICQQRGLDQPMKVKMIDIDIKANAFVAKTFIEIEFYNDQDREIEGVQYFKLNKGQVVSAFQLELAGKYRDGSIEERWKASTAYNSIVGKRIDPAILQLDYNDNYRLNIYPFAPKSSRKITMTLLQELSCDDNGLLYQLPLAFKDTVARINVSVSVDRNLQQPFIRQGLLKGDFFSSSPASHSLSWKKDSFLLNGSLQFRIPVNANQYFFLWQKDAAGKNEFALKLQPDVPATYQINSEDLAVFWDVSASSYTRDIQKEISFLRQFLQEKKIKTLDLYTFSDKIRSSYRFDLKTYELRDIENYLLKLSYAGTTDYGSLDFSKISSNHVLLFTDGYQSAGNKTFKPGACVVSCIVSADRVDVNNLQQFSEKSGGKVIFLNRPSKGGAIYDLPSTASNMLYSVEGLQTAIQVHEDLPIKSNCIKITGTGDGSTLLKLKFGNNATINRQYDLMPNMQADSALDVIAILKLLKRYKELEDDNDWQELLLFGLENRVVTRRTAFIVLERIEDYINYNIAPPKELEKQCEEMGYVYKSNHRRQELKAFSEAGEIKTVVSQLLPRINWWNRLNANSITAKDPAASTAGTTAFLSTGEKEGTAAPASATTGSPVATNFPAGENRIAEVVVTSAFNTKRTARSVSASVQNVSAAQLNTVRAPDVNNALAGKVAGLQVRSQSGVALGRETSIRLRGENSLTGGRGALYVLDGTIMPDVNDINPDDIEDLTVLQGPAATALFGSEGANGAIVINSKRPRKWYGGYYDYSEKLYKLSEMEDVDYLVTMKETDKSLMWDRYLQLRRENIEDVAFYFDVAELFYKNNMKQKAFFIMEEGIEMTNGSGSGKKAAAYMYESWGEFEKAIQLYQELLEANKKDIATRRDLALCYYQNKQYQLALDTYLTALTSEAFNYYEGEGLKQTILQEMNAVITTQGDNLDIPKPDASLFISMPADIFLSAESNFYSTRTLTIFGPSQQEFNIGYRSQISYSTEANNSYFSEGGNLAITSAEQGKYKVQGYFYGYKYLKAPHYCRIIVFKDFQRKDQSLEIQLVKMDNQYGNVEIGSFVY